MEFYSDCEAVLTGDAEIEELSDTVLKIKCDEHLVLFSGNNLEINNFSKNGIRIDGRIDSMEFLRKKS